MTDLQLIEKYGKEYLPGFYEGRLISHGPFLEEWKDVKGYEGQFKISNYSNLISCERFVTWNKVYKKHIAKKYLSKMRGKDAYLVCTLKGENQKSKCFSIARLVGMHFIDNPENKPCINHIKGFKDDNMFTQLEWVTHSENTKHRYDVLKHKPWHAGIHVNNKMKLPVSGTCIKSGNNIIFTHFKDLKDAGFCIGHVNQCARGERQTHKNHKWIYLNELNNII